MIEAPALQCVVNFPGPVGRDDDNGRLVRPDGADLGNGDLEVGQHLQQIGLERLIGPVELVDQQDGRAVGLRLQALQKRPLDQELIAENIRFQRIPVPVAGRLGHADLHHLTGIVPFIDRGGDVETLIALETQQPPAKGFGQDLGDLGLADTGLALEEQGPAQAQREIQRRRQAAVGQVVPAPKGLDGVVDGTRKGCHGVRFHCH